MATRLRQRSEDIGCLGEILCGCRRGRSTADGTQVVLRIDEQTRRDCGKDDDVNIARPAAVLDITKAYPRVNKTFLWRILDRLGMTKGTLDILKSLHENTAYRVNGREGPSDEWLPARGLTEGVCHVACFIPCGSGQVRTTNEAGRRRELPGVRSEVDLEHEKQSPSKGHPQSHKEQHEGPYEDYDSLFADDSTLIGWSDELETGKQRFKEAMLLFEETCHDGKGEYIKFGKGANKTRVIGDDDRKKRRPKCEDKEKIPRQE